MAIKVKAVERNISFDKNSEEYGYVMMPELYNRLNEDKVVAEASAHSGISQSLIRASCAAIADVVLAWVPEGHSVSIPYFGTMRFSLNSKSVSSVAEVGTDLITSRKIIYTPSVEIKSGLEQTSVNITCYDRTGKVVKKITSDGTLDYGDDDGNTSTDPDNNGNPDNQGGGGTEGGGDLQG